MPATPSGSGSFSGPVVELSQAAGTGRVVLVCEHAGRFIPPEYDNLGLGAGALTSHIAWDLGARALARALSERLDAPLLAGTVSRLVYDCNRPPQADTAVPTRSAGIDIPGNTGLSATDRLVRAERVYLPFRAALTNLLDARAAQALPTALVTIHSFTPVFEGKRRSIDIGILHDEDDARLAEAMLDACAVAPNLADTETPLEIRRNVPYGPADGVTHTLREHALPRDLPNVMIEVRNDLIADDDVGRVADWLAARLTSALAALPVANG